MRYEFVTKFESLWSGKDKEVLPLSLYVVAKRIREKDIKKEKMERKLCLSIFWIREKKIRKKKKKF